MKPQRLLILDNSEVLRVAGVNAVSVRARTVPFGGVVPPLGSTADVPRAWTVVPHAARPGAIGAASVPAIAGAGAHVGAAGDPGPLAPAGPARVVRSLMTTEVGDEGVRVLLIKSLSTESDHSAFGVT